MSQSAISFVVPGRPCAKAKKLAVCNGHARGYNDPQTELYQNQVTTQARRARPADWDGQSREPLYSVRVIAVFARPKRLLERRKDDTLKNGALEGRMPYRGKPDLDNVYKAVCDGLTRAAVWADDCQIDNHDGSRRYYAAAGEDPHTEVRVARVDGVAEAPHETAEVASIGVTVGTLRLEFPPGTPPEAIEARVREALVRRHAAQTGGMSCARTTRPPMGGSLL